MVLFNLFGAGPRRETMPLFPLGTVLFPGSLLPLRIFEVRYMDMAKACLKDGTPFGVCLIREGEEVGAPAVPEPIGCVARIAECDMEELGILKVKAEGLERFRIVSSEVNRHGLIVGEVERLDTEAQVTQAPGLAEILPLRNDVKQKLLELTDATLRLAILHKFLRQQRLLP